MELVQLSDKVSSCVCPYCGADAFVYGEKFLCHNCQRHQNYDHLRSNHSIPRVSGSYITPTVDYSSVLRNLQVLADLHSGHPALSYARRRQWPDWCLSYLYYCESFREVAAATDKRAGPAGRIIIPFWNDGKLFGLQGRSICGEEPKYLTIMYNEDEEKIFGKDRVDLEKPFYAVEGPIDSLFLENAVALAGSDILDTKYSQHATVCLDNEPRNPQIVKKMKKYLDLGFKIVIWPDNIKDKDINDMVLAGHNPEAIMADNVFSGLQGTVRLNSWKKV